VKTLLGAVVVLGSVLSLAACGTAIEPAQAKASATATAAPTPFPAFYLSLVIDASGQSVTIYVKSDSRHGREVRDMLVRTFNTSQSGVVKPVDQLPTGASFDCIRQISSGTLRGDAFSIWDDGSLLSETAATGVCDSSK
jgi:ABC-type glycerol-3-phosphate transport system substrate-binding protein